MIKAKIATLTLVSLSILSCASTHLIENRMPQQVGGELGKSIEQIEKTISLDPTKDTEIEFINYDICSFRISYYTEEEANKVGGIPKIHIQSKNTNDNRFTISAHQMARGGFLEIRQTCKGQESEPVIKNNGMMYKVKLNYFLDSKGTFNPTTLNGFEIK
jgi:hypothetical protein